MIQKFSMWMQRIICALFIIGSICGALSGCSAARLAYGNGESLSYWWMDGYVDFDAEQGAAARSDIATLFDWHRRTQLPDYVQLLDAAEKRLQRGVVLAEAGADIAAVKLRLRRMTERAAPALADLALSLQPAQLKRLQEKFASNNDAYRKETMRGSIEERQLRRFKKVMQQAEYWFGDFSDEQAARIRAASDARPLDPDLVYADRLQRQAEMMHLLTRLRAEKPARAEAAGMIAALLDIERQHQGAPERKAYFDALEAANARLVVMIVNGTTDSQRARAAARARQWMVDLKAMSRG